MTDYILSTHPTWDLLSCWGLPNEIINIIFKYKTYFTPIQYTLPEYKKATTESDFRLEELGYRSTVSEYAEPLILFRNMVFKNKNKYNIITIGKFIKNNSKYYMASPDELLQMFWEYHSYVYGSVNNIELKMKLKLIKNIKTLLTNNSTIVMCSSLLKHCCTIKFQDNIAFIKRAYKISTYPNMFSPTYCSAWRWANEIKYIWKMITFIVTTKNCDGRFSKAELQVYNFIMGYPFYKSWSRDRLVQNLVHNEPYDNSNLYYLLHKNYHIDISTLIEIFSKVSISTSTYVCGKRINYPLTLNYMIPAYNNYLLDTNVTIWDDNTQSNIVPLITIDL